MAAKKKLRVGIIGTGGIAHAHANAYKQFEDVEKERPAEACRKITGKYTTLGAVSKFLGSNVR